MRTIILSLICLFSMNSYSQPGIKTITFTVKGNCEECKERIENGADIKGVKLCKWNTETKVATVTFDQSKVSLEQIQKAIAAKGYDAGQFKGDDVAYGKLPKCCKYRNGVCEPAKK